ncbi:MAG TPA: TIGR04283 family arsenosugar biosynthesis glycosyltransferase [Burkholderiales bacterium]
MPDAARPTVAVVVPVDVEPDVDRYVENVLALAPDELIVVDAGDPPTRASLERALQARPDARVRLLGAPRGRAVQMNAGACTARSDVLLFLHADTVLPPDALERVRAAIAGGAVWGRFEVRLSGRAAAFRVIERLMNLRSALTGIATGDQALFVRRDAFRVLGGFPPIALMEDIELSSRLKWIAPPHRIRSPVLTSSRRWERNGVARTVLRMWLLRGLYALGVAPGRLAQWYNGAAWRNRR